MDHSSGQTAAAHESEQPAASRVLARRGFLAGLAAWLGLAVARAWLPPSDAEAGSPSRTPVDPTRVPGDPATPYGRRSTFEHAQRAASGQRSLTPHQDLHGIVTPSALHFERHHNGVPLIDPSRHKLLVHGLVDRPMIFTMDDLKRFPSVSRLAFIECSGNSGNEWTGPRGRTAQDTHGLLSTSEWTGVPLAIVLAEVGLKPGATWMLAEGSDAGALARSVPLREAMEEALLCYAQNGEVLRPEQGYPLRLLMPGWEGNICIKWLRRLKLGDAPFMTREETSKYTDLMPDGTARQFTQVMDAKSLITHPSGGHPIQPGFVEIRGLAWSGRGRITEVAVSTDGGRSWERASLEGPVLPKCCTRFRFPWHWNGQETLLQSRCTDETGYVQPTLRALVAIRGVHSYYHNNAIQSWRISSGGEVTNAHV